MDGEYAEVVRGQHPEVEAIDRISNPDDLGSEYTMKLFAAVANPSRVRKKPRRGPINTVDGDGRGGGGGDDGGGDDDKLLVPKFHPNDPTTNPDVAKSKKKTDGVGGGTGNSDTGNGGTGNGGTAWASDPASPAMAAVARGHVNGGLSSAPAAAAAVPVARRPPQVQDVPLWNAPDLDDDPDIYKNFANVAGRGDDDDDEFWNEDGGDGNGGGGAARFDEEVDSMQAIDNFERYAPTQLRRSPTFGGGGGGGGGGGRSGATALSRQAPSTPPPRQLQGQDDFVHAVREVESAKKMAPTPPWAAAVAGSKGAFRSSDGQGYRQGHPQGYRFATKQPSRGSLNGSKGYKSPNRSNGPNGPNGFLHDVFADESLQGRQSKQPPPQSNPHFQPPTKFANPYAGNEASENHGGANASGNEQPPPAAAFPTQNEPAAPTVARPMTEEERKFDEVQKRAQWRFYEKKLRDEGVTVHPDDDLMTLKYLFEEMELKRKIKKGGHKKRAQIENVIAMGKAVNRLIGDHLPISDWDYESELDNYDDAFEEIYRREFQLRGKEVDMNTIVQSLAFSLGKHVFDEVSNTFANHRLGLGEEAGARHRGPRSHPFTQMSVPPPPSWQTQRHGESLGESHGDSREDSALNPNRLHAARPRYATVLPDSPSATVTGETGDTAVGKAAAAGGGSPTATQSETASMGPPPRATRRRFPPPS